MQAVCHPAVRYLATNQEVTDYLAGSLRQGDVVITLSAGDANLISPMTLEALKHA